MGSAAIYHAARRGLRVLGLEQFSQVPHTLGSHHGSTRIIRKAYFEDPGYVPLVLRAYDLWEQLERETNQKLLVKCGGLMIGNQASEAVSGSIRSAVEHGLPYEVLSSQEVHQRFRAFVLKEDQVAVFEPDAGYLFSELAVQAHMRQAAMHGAEIRLGVKVSEWSSEGGSVAVKIGEETVYAEQLILTVGAWAPEFVPKSISLSVERQVLTWFRTPGSEMQNIPIYLFEQEDGTQFYGFPEIDGQGAKVALHHSGSTSTADTLDREVRPKDIDRVLAAVRHSLPAIAQGKYLTGSACMYTNTQDDHFVVGHHPEHDNVVLGMGYSGHGFKFASAMGEMLVNLARGERSLAVPSIFSPKRWQV